MLKNERYCMHWFPFNQNVFVIQKRKMGAISPWREQCHRHGRNVVGIHVYVYIFACMRVCVHACIYAWGVDQSEAPRQISF